MKISVVIPIYNERENIPGLYRELLRVLSILKQDYEIIFVDDGSTDSSVDILKELKATNPNIKILSLDRNYGLSTAISAGIEKAQGDIIITIDGDLQNDTGDIPKLLGYIHQGYDVVSGWRKNRKDPLVKKFSSKIANFIRNKLTSEDIKDSACMLKAYKKEYI
ncbi:MAG TPA: glycosyltransferase, partial [Candidatus Omnitrophica bacterium]|nr:glycosyltransferase [Candidatus Omnitrophota bacterium]